MKRSIVTLFALAVAVAACGSQTASPSSATMSPPGASSRAPEPPPSAGSGVRPIVFDTDMGMDDLLALYVILRDPAFDVRAIAIDGTGLIRCSAGIRNMRRILGAFDRLDIPFGCGREQPGPNGRSFPDDWRASADAMYGVVLPPVVASKIPSDAVTLLHEALAASPEPVTVLAVGTWTNLADLLAAHPDDLARIGGIHAMAGTIDDPGNIDLEVTKPADKVEWNVGADPDAFVAVLALDVPVTLVPLDATNDVPVPGDILQQLNSDHTAAGADIAFETYARSPYLYGEGNYWWDASAVVALNDPGLATWEDVTVSVTNNGPGAGRINRDASGRPVRVALAADGARTTNAILAGLRRGAPRPEPFNIAGTLTVTWDGTTCRTEGSPPTNADLARVDFRNRSTAPAGLLAAGVRPPKTWADAAGLIDGLDFSDSTTVVPDWVIQVDGNGPWAEAGMEAIALSTLPAGLVGVVCGTGAWPDIALTDGGSFTLEE